MLIYTTPDGPAGERMELLTPWGRERPVIVDVPGADAGVILTAPVTLSGLTTPVNCTGSLTIPANTMQLTNKWAAAWRVKFTRGAVNTALTMISRFNIGGFPLSLSRVATTINGQVNIFQCTAEFVVTALGAAGNCMVGFSFLCESSGTNAAFTNSTVQVPIALDTTIDNVITGTHEMATAIVGCELFAYSGGINRVF